jgi:hypothetical protein
MGPRGNLVDEKFPTGQLKQFETKYPDPLQTIHNLTPKSGRSLGYN